MKTIFVAIAVMFVSFAAQAQQTTVISQIGQGTVNIGKTTVTGRFKALKALSGQGTVNIGKTTVTTVTTYQNRAQYSLERARKYAGR